MQSTAQQPFSFAAAASKAAAAPSANQVNASLLDKRSKVESLVLDSGPLIKGHNLAHLAHNFVTIAEVVQELRDQKTRDAIMALPFELAVRVPSEEAIAAVVAFAKKTGDFGVLSLTDIKIIALAWMLEKEKNGVAHIRTEPLRPSLTSGGKAVAPQPLNARQQISAPATSTATASDDVNAPSQTDTTSTTDAKLEKKRERRRQQRKRRHERDLEKKRLAQLRQQGQDQQDQQDKSHFEGEAGEVDAAMHSGPSLESMQSIEATFVRPSLADQILDDDADAIADAEANDDEYGEDSYPDRNDETMEEHLDSEDAEIGGDEMPDRITDELMEYENEEAMEYDARDSRNNTESAGADIEDGNDDDDDDGDDDVVDEEQAEDDKEAEDDGWITPKNIAKIKARDAYGASSDTDPKSMPSVACMTTDFAMQNVLMQMNLKVLSVDGVVVRQLKNWVMRCHACFKVTKDMEKRFCPSCGNNTLMRTSYSIDANGQARYFLKRNFQYNLRGTTFSIPMPKGGKAGRNTNPDMILREDQREHQKALKEKERFDKRLLKHSDAGAMDLSSIFADSSSLLSKTGAPIIGAGRRNVNEAKRGRRRK
eukprot:jgi/Hompol1/1028/HPOL_004430-RA